MTLNTGARLGPYEVLTPIGAGGMGEVYRARDTRLGRLVAIKVIASRLLGDDHARARFEREARAIAALSHPRICTLYDVGSVDGVEFLVMEHLEGETLGSRLARQTGRLPMPEVIQIATQLADALAAAHRAGVVHRDLKPANIMLTQAGRSRHGAPEIKVLDFGLAKLPVLASDDRTTTGDALTDAQTIFGTLPYMAPEQLEGGSADARTDIFAFGAIVYEIASGRRAFEGNKPANLIGAILRDTPPALSTIQPLTPPLLDRVVATCLAKDPEDRWQSARDLTRELKSIQEAPTLGVARSSEASGNSQWVLGSAVAGALASFPIVRRLSTVVWVVVISLMASLVALVSAQIALGWTFTRNEMAMIILMVLSATVVGVWRRART